MAFIFRKAEPVEMHELTASEIGQVAGSVGGHTHRKLETTYGGGPYVDDGTECDVAETTTTHS